MSSYIPDLAGSPGSQHSNRRQAEILDRHLPEGYSAEPDASLLGHASILGPSASGLSLDQASNADSVESSLRLQGGDMHRDMFKIKARANSIRRSATFSHQPSPRLGHPSDLSYPEQREPGGFRRHHVRRRARQRPVSSYTAVTRNFVDFLDLYGSFAGEDLDDDDSSEDESAVDDYDDSVDPEQVPELRPLLGHSRSSTRRPRREGDASTLKTFFTLIKAFIGTGILLLPKAFRNGGILFSSVALIVLSLVNCLCFRLLLDCRERYGGGYGELGATIVGPRFRSLILASIAISQLGFVCAGLIFSAENLKAFLDAVTQGDGSFGVGVPALIAVQLILLVPLALIRNISKLGPVALLADAFILIGLSYIWYFDIWALAKEGMEPSVRLFNPSDYTLTIGSAIFTFEGIGLILPIQSSMKKPEHFPNLLYFVMFLITIIFTSVGALCYATFGEGTKIQILSNFPQESPVVNAVQFLYSMAVLAGDPVQLFPAARIIETSIFGELATGKKSSAIKWKKNALRTAIVGVCTAISMVGASDLDKFVALIGSFACVPLVYIYPAYLHYKGAAEKTWVKVLDIALMVVGLVGMVYTTMVTASQWVQDK
ncbi:transmembrane amino acid transporter protein-domain-containing protein [Dactylonectria estremocensis]|uniref:Transmembrane amino acid transporter protein-domain-containing protein n=1 Tax=Dactylonectria estremocensis TaxID=1079267 RepID=A0A9P9EBD5_9HYPO|nr:transmembrane amino acid transporter protein-domain-containing protein [Dactylonectria estremocensis]